MHKKTLLFTIASFTSLLFGASHAVASEPAHFSEQQIWAGAYVGGYFGHHRIETAGVFDAVELGVLPVLDQIGDKGFHGGLHAGYLWQYGIGVFGVEVDYSIGKFEESFESVQDGSVSEAGLFSYPIGGELDYLVTTKARAGITFDGPRDSSILVFATAGLAFTEFIMDIADGRSTVGFSDTGAVYGGGVEIALSHRLSLRAEYLKINFGKRLDIANVSVSGVFDANDGNYVRLDDVDLVRIALSFRPFN